MNQKLAWSMIGVGLSVFLAQFAELLHAHSSWAELTTPASVGEMMVLVSSLLPTIAGAFGIRLESQALKSKKSPKGKR